MDKVLIADDDLITRKLLQKILCDSGYEVIAVDNGAAAYDALIQHTDICLSILDWMMPGMNGVDICRKLYQENQTRIVYIVLLTAQEGIDCITEALQSGANDYIRKPFKKAELLARLNVGQRIIALQSQLSQAQKMESIGQLAAGLAHEINTPAQYLGDNANFLRDAFNDIAILYQKYALLFQTAREQPQLQPLLQDIKTVGDEIDISYLMEEIPEAINQSINGIQKISKIVGSMKEFSSPNSLGWAEVYINDVLDNVLEVVNNLLTSVAEVVRKYDPDIPVLNCIVSQVNQALVNILINAADAIETKFQNKSETSPGKGKIVISTSHQEDYVQIEITDNGCGIDDNIKDSIFNPFFTTKAVGKGVGQGLTVAHSIIVDNNHGSITYTSNPDQGTKFTIQLPLNMEGSDDLWKS